MMKHIDGKVVIILIYLILASIWAFFSGKFMLWLVGSPEQALRWDVYNHLAFVLVTIILAYVSLRHLIAERRQTAQALHRSEANLQALFDSAPQAYYLLDRDFRILSFNKVSHQTLWAVWSKEVAVGDSILDYVLPANRELFKANYQRSLKGETVIYERKLILPGDKVAWYELMYVPVYDRAGEISGVSFSAWDISDRKQAQEAVNFQADLLDTVGQAVIATDIHGTVIYWNRYAQTLYGWSRDEAMGCNIADLTIPAGGMQIQAAEIMAQVRAGRRWSGEFTVRGKDGRNFPAWVTNSPIYDLDQQQIIGAVGISTDISDRKETEEALRHSEERYRRLVETMREGLAEIDENGMYIFVNPSFCRLLGYTAAEIIGHDPREFLDDENYQIILSEFRKRKRGVAERYEIAFTRKDGQKVYFTVSPQIRTDEQGRYLGGYGVFTDISDRKATEEALRRSEERYRRLVETMREGLAEVDENGIYTFVNRSFACMLGYRSEAIIGQDRRRFLDQTSLQIAEAEWAKQRQGGMDRYEISFTREDGSKTDCIVAPQVFLDEQGRFQGSYEVFTDITTRKQVESALRESQERLTMAQKVAHLGSWELDLDSGQSIWSDEFFRICGYEPQSFEPTMERGLQLIHPEDRDRATQAVTKAVETGELYSIEKRIVRPDGSIRYVLSQGEVIADEAGQPARLIGAFLDITERRRLAEQLRQSQKMDAVGRLAGGVAHDFNNILTVIAGYCGLLTRSLDEETAPYRYAVEIEKARERASTLTRQLLAFSRQQVLEPTTLNLNTIINDMEQMLQRLIGEDITLITCLDPSSGPVKADPGQLQQVILNLVANARDAMPRGGTLTLTTGDLVLSAPELTWDGGISAGAWVVLTVTDTGDGIDAETRNQIFDPFFTTKDFGKGTGLGLAMVHGIVKQSGGQITVDSSPDRGTTFRIFLPRVDEDGNSTQQAIPSQANHRGSGTILVVEDEGPVRQLTRNILAMHGYQVVTAAQAEEAVQLMQARGDEIDMLLIDVVLPGEMDGLALAKEVSARHPNLRVLFMSGYTNTMLAQRGLSEDRDPLLRKPFTPDGLVERVQEMLACRS